MHVIVFPNFESLDLTIKPLLVFSITRDGALQKNSPPLQKGFTLAPIQQGQRVHFFCSSYLSTGECIDSDTNEPVRMIAGMTAKGNEFSKAVSHSLVGMTVDEAKQFQVPARFAFGERDPGKVFKLLLDETPDGDVGDEVEFEFNRRKQGQLFIGTIIKKDSKFSYIDTNHPMAGEDLTVKIRVISFE